MKPVIDQQAGQIAKLEGQLSEANSAYIVLQRDANLCNESVDALKAASDAAKAKSDAALAAATKLAESLKTQAEWLAEQLAKPDIKQLGCVDALKSWRAQP